MFRQLNILFLILALASGTPLLAQDQSVKDLVDTEDQTEQIIEKKRTAIDDDQVDASTPLAMLVSMAKAVESDDADLIASFVDMRYLPEPLVEQGPIVLLDKLSTIWRQQKILDLTTVSDDPSGHLDDGLPSYRDLLGNLRGKSGSIPIYLQRVPDDKGEIGRAHV